VGTERRASVPCQLQEACLSCPKRHLPQIFKDRRRRSRRLEGRGALPAVRPYLRASRFQGRRCLRATTPTPREGDEDDRRTVKEGREPSLGPPSMSLGSFTSPWCGPWRTRSSHAPPSRSRNLDLVPFRWRARRPSATRPLRGGHRKEGLRSLPTAGGVPELPQAHPPVRQNPAGTPAT
jgi:hypothetical protein